MKRLKRRFARKHYLTPERVEQFRRAREDQAYKLRQFKRGGSNAGR